MVPPQFTAVRRPHPVPTDRKRNIGRTRLHLLKFSAEPLRKEFDAVLLLPCTNRQFSEKRMGRVLVFVIAFILVNLTTSFPGSQRFFLGKSRFFRNFDKKKYSCRDFHRRTNVWADFSVKNNYTCSKNKNQPLTTPSMAGTDYQKLPFGTAHRPFPTSEIKAAGRCTNHVVLLASHSFFRMAHCMVFS